MSDEVISLAEKLIKFKTISHYYKKRLKNALVSLKNMQKPTIFNMNFMIMVIIRY